MNLLRSCLLILVCLIVSTSIPVVEDDDVAIAPPVNQHCEWLLKTEYFHQICYGRINRELHLKYKDQLVAPDTPFAIWHSETEHNYYFVTFHISPLINCTRFKYLENHSFLCNRPPRARPIKIARDRIYCFDFSVQYVRELTLLCYEQSNKMGRLPPPVAFSALHYSASAKELNRMSQAHRTRSALWSTVVVPNVLVLIVARVLQMW